jgi:hypothetical protein
MDAEQSLTHWRWTARARPVVELRPDGVWLALPARELLDAQAEA